VSEYYTVGYFTVRFGGLFLATDWRWFSNPDFTMKGISHDRSDAIRLFQKTQRLKNIYVPDEAEFQDYDQQTLGA
jgi:hypothetical protein